MAATDLHARDTLDKRLVEAGDHQQLLADYFPAVRERCFLWLRHQDEANEAAQQVFERLLKELRSGKTYRVPFRIVVWNVTEWTLRGFHRGAKHDASLPEGSEPPAPDEAAAWEERYDLELLLAELPEGQREVARHRYLDGLEPGEIAGKLGIDRNAVYQRLFNAHRTLAERLSA